MKVGSQCVAPPCHPGRFGIQICFFFSEKLYIYRNEVRNQTEQNAWSPQTIVINFNLFHLMIGMMKTLLLKYLLFAAILVNSVDSASVRIPRNEVEVEVGNVTEAARYESILNGLDNTHNTTNSSNEDSKLVLTNLMKNFVQNTNSRVEENVTISSKRDQLDQLIKQLNQFQEPATRDSKLEDPSFTNYFPDYGDPPSDLKSILSKEYASYNFSDFSDPYKLSTFRTPLESFGDEAVSPLPKSDEVYLSQDSILANDVQRLALPLVGIATTKNGGQLDPDKLQAGAETINIVVSPNFGEDDEGQGSGVAIFPQSEMSRLRSNITNLTGLDIDRLVEEVSAVVGKIDSPLRVEELHTQITRQEGRPPMYKYTETTAQVIPTDDARNPNIEILSKRVKDGELDSEQESAVGIASREVSPEDLKVNVTTKTNIVNIFTFNILVANKSDSSLNLSRVKPYKTKIETTANVDTGSGHNTVSVYKYQAEDADLTPKRHATGPATPELEKWLKILLQHQVSGSKEDGNLIQEAVLRDASLLQIPGDSFNHRGTFYRNVETNSNTTDDLNQQSNPTKTTPRPTTTTQSNNIGPLGFYVNGGDSQTPGALGEIQKFVESMGVGAIPTLFVGALATYTLLTGRKKRDLSGIGENYPSDLTFPNVKSLRLRHARSDLGTGTVKKIYHVSDKEKNASGKVDIPDHWLAYLLGTKHTAGLSQTSQPVTTVSLPRDGRDSTSDTVTPTPLESFSKQVFPSSSTLTTIRRPNEGSNSYQITKLKYPLTTSPMPYTLGQNTLMDKWNEMLKPKSTTPNEPQGSTLTPDLTTTSNWEHDPWGMRNDSTSEPLVIGSDVAVSVSTVTEINFVPGKNAPFYSGVKSTEVPPSVWLTAQDIFSGLGQAILPNETVNEINPIFFNNRNGLGVTVIESETQKPSQSKLLIESFLNRMNASDSEEGSSEYPVTQHPLKPAIITGNRPRLTKNPIPGEVVINSGVIKTKITPNVASEIIRKSQDQPGNNPEAIDVSDTFGGLENFVNLFSTHSKPMDHVGSSEDAVDFKMKIASVEADNSDKQKSPNLLESFFNLSKEDKTVVPPPTEDATVDPVVFIPSYSDTTDVLKLAYGGTQDLFDSLESNQDLAIKKLIEQLEKEYNSSVSKEDSHTGGQSQLTNKMDLLPDDLVDSFPNSPWVFTQSEMENPHQEYMELSPAASNEEILELIKSLERDVTNPEVPLTMKETPTLDLKPTDLESLFSFDRPEKGIERKENQGEEDSTSPDLDDFHDELEVATTPGFTTESSTSATVIPQPLFAHLDLRDITDQTSTSTTTVSTTTEVSTTTQAPSAVDILKNILSQSAAPLAGLSAASLAYGAAALLPLWLPLALGKKKKRRRRRRRSFFDREQIDNKFFYYK